jgi:hypothetical protein
LTAALSAAAFAQVVHSPVILAAQTTFTIPTGSPAAWKLELWSHGTLEASAEGGSGMLSVATPATTDCTFQADVFMTPPGGKSYFYSGSRATVPGCGPPPPTTIAGDIDLCGASVTSEVPGGTLAVTGPQTLASQPNPLTPTPVTASPGYTMTATAPSGYVFVICGGTATVGSSGVTASEPVVVPNGGPGVGVFYVQAAGPVGTLSGGGPPAGTGSGAGPATSAGQSQPVGTLAHGTETAVATKVGSSSLAFTGMNAVPLLLCGLGALILGALATVTSRLRRRTAVVDSVSSPSVP